jgi:hypothetical protein
LTLSAITDHRSLSEGFDRTNIHGTPVPVLSTAEQKQASMAE